MESKNEYFNSNRICFTTRECESNDGGGKRYFSLRADKIMNYQKRMLSEGGCPFTLPMHFILDEGIEKAYYDYSGLVQMKEFIGRIRSTDHSAGNDGKLINIVLNLLADLMDCLKGMEEYLLFPDAVSIESDLIFVDMQSEKAIFAYNPYADPEISIQDRILCLIDSINEMCQDSEADQYLCKLKDLIYQKNPGTDGMISMLGTMKREISYIYWEPINFRSQETKESGSNENYAGNQDVDHVCMAKVSRFPANDKSDKIKLIAIQTAAAALLIGVFLSGILDMTNFAGLVIILAGADLLIMRKIQNK